MSLSLFIQKAEGPQKHLSLRRPFSAPHVLGSIKDPSLFKQSNFQFECACFVVDTGPKRYNAESKTSVTDKNLILERFCQTLNIYVQLYQTVNLYVQPDINL